MRRGRVKKTTVLALGFGVLGLAALAASGCMQTVVGPKHTSQTQGPAHSGRVPRSATLATADSTSDSTAAGPYIWDQD